MPADPVRGREIRALVELLAGEVGERGAGSRAAAARLIDLLLIAALRRWSDEQPEEGRPSWLTALRDPLVGRALRGRMHVAAQRLKHGSKTVQEIAREVGYTSEFAFNRAFVRHRGQPPGRYRRLARAA